MRQQDKSKNLIDCEAEIADCMHRSCHVLERLHLLAVMQEMEVTLALHTPEDLERVKAFRQAIETLLTYA